MSIDISSTLRSFRRCFWQSLVGCSKARGAISDYTEYRFACIGHDRITPCGLADVSLAKTWVKYPFGTQRFEGFYNQMAVISICQRLRAISPSLEGHTVVGPETRNLAFCFSNIFSLIFKSTSSCLLDLLSHLIMFGPIFKSTSAILSLVITLVYASTNFQVLFQR